MGRSFSLFGNGTESEVIAQIMTVKHEEGNDHKEWRRNDKGLEKRRIGVVFVARIWERICEQTHENIQQ